MRAVVQRVTSGSVTVDGEVVGRCGKGLLLLVAAHKDDTEREVVKLAEKIGTLRIFNDAEGKMNHSIVDVGGSVLAISNFTVYGDAGKQRRPSFMDAAGFDRGKELFDSFVERLKSLGLPTQTGVFGAHMDVDIQNDGPVTLIVDVAPA